MCGKVEHGLIVGTVIASTKTRSSQISQKLEREYAYLERASGGVVPGEANCEGREVMRAKLIAGF
jgi:hypothetical protein